MRKLGIPFLNYEKLVKEPKKEIKLLPGTGNSKKL